MSGQYCANDYLGFVPAGKTKNMPHNGGEASYGTIFGLFAAESEKLVIQSDL